MSFFARLIRLPLSLVPDGMVVRILSGELRGWRWITGSATHGCWLGTYEPESRRAFRQFVREGDVVCDIGANVGFFTLLASKLAGAGGTVYAFEPVPRNLHLLRRHVSLNDAQNVTILPVAVSSRSGVAHFAAAANPAMGGLSESGSLEVQTEALDELISLQRIAPPSFLKIDVEGAEVEVLTGAANALRDSVRTILLSTHGFARHEESCALLRTARFDLQLLRDGARDGNYVVLARRA